MRCRTKPAAVLLIFAMVIGARCTKGQRSKGSRLRRLEEGSSAFEAIDPTSEPLAAGEIVARFLANHPELPTNRDEYKRLMQSLAEQLFGQPALV